MEGRRDKNGRFTGQGSGSADPVLSEHQSNLASLRVDYEKLLKLSGKSAELERDRGNWEHWVESIAERLLEGPDPELEEELANLDTKLVSVKAQAELNSRLERSAEEVLQKRLPADSTACERLYGYWLSHVKERESARLLESLEPGEVGKVEVQQAARTLAIASKSYARTLAELGEAAPVSYAWTRPLDPLPREKSAAIQSLLTHGPLFRAPPKRSDTVAALPSPDWFLRGLLRMYESGPLSAGVLEHR